MAPSLENFIAKPKKFVLTVGDEGAILIYMEGSKVLRRMFSPSPNETKQFISLFKTDEKAAIQLLVDVMDQTYVPQTLPPVSPISVNKLIQRRLDRDFPPDDLRGALLIGRAEEGRKDWNYLFAAVSNVPPLSPWIKLVEELPNPLEGIYLLPVEAESIMSRILPSSGKKAKQPLINVSKNPKTPQADYSTHSRWQVLVSHQKVGGFRQIVFRDGKLTFTRLAQPIGDPTPEVIAGNVEQELSNTIEYLKRLSFNPRDGLDVVVIVASEIRTHLKIQDSNIRHVHIRTPHEIAQQLKLAKATEETDHFGDVVLAAAFGSQTKHHLRLFTPYTQKLAGLYTAKRYGLFGGIALALLALVGIGSVAGTLYQAEADADFVRRSQETAQANLVRAQSEKASLPSDLSHIADIVTLYNMLSEKYKNPLLFFSRLHKNLDEKTLITAITWDSTPPFAPKETAASQTSAREAGDVKTEITVRFNSNTGTLKQLHKRAYDFFDRVGKNFSQYKLEHDELPGQIGANEVWKQNFNNVTGSLLPSQDLDVKFFLSYETPKTEPPAQEVLP